MTRTRRLGCTERENLNLVGKNVGCFPNSSHSPSHAFYVAAVDFHVSSVFELCVRQTIIAGVHTRSSVYNIGNYAVSRPIPGT